MFLMYLVRSKEILSYQDKVMQKCILHVLPSGSSKKLLHSCFTKSSFVPNPNGWREILAQTPPAENKFDQFFQRVSCIVAYIMYYKWCLVHVVYISSSVWVLRTQNAGWNLYFPHFLCKKAEKCKKGTNLLQKWAKNWFLKFAPKRWSNVLFPA